ncbi:restriction endonuclease subunit S [Gemella sp. 27098_8_149]|uniref:restriction endonuclease subunit S n=1 Tax=Gemella sp. 27098_8_149 TaxID=3003689 RepID=UPI00352E8F24
MIKYENYELINLPWLKEIPKNWNKKKLKKISRFKTGNSIKDEIKNKYSKKDNSYLFITTSDIDGEKLVINHQSSIFIPKSEKGFRISEVGSTLLCIEGGSGGKKVAFTSQLVCYGNKLCSIKLDLGVDKYLYYVLVSNMFKIYYNMNISGDRNGISQKNVGEFVLPFPNISEQQQIADYLDWKIREIDKLIDIEKQQIKDIERLKKIIISQYYNELPIKRRIKTLIQSPLVYGINEAGKTNGKIRFIRITDIEKNGSLKKDGKQYINDCEKKYILEKGDILFARSGGTVGKTYLHQDISNNELMAFAGYLIRARFDVNLVNPEYIYYYTQSESYTEWKNSIFIQSTIQNISAEKYSNLEIPYCSLNIQNKIVEKIKQKLLEINKLKEKSLEKQFYLVSLKESIISEVVTGQIDVRNEKIPERK